MARVRIKYSPSIKLTLAKLQENFQEEEIVGKLVKKINCVECLGTGKDLYDNEICCGCEGKKFSYQIDF